MNAETVLVGWGLAVLLLLAGMFRFAFHTRRQNEELVARMERQIEDLEALREAHSRRLQEAETRLAMLGEQQDLLLMRDADAGPYTQAIRAARAGSSAEELIRQFGMSEGEAELVVRLHKKDRG